nr:hypothetical protein Iba_chr06aCG2160 [Ipomoea batatas]
MDEESTSSFSSPAVKNASSARPSPRLMTPSPLEAALERTDKPARVWVQAFMMANETIYFIDMMLPHDLNLLGIYKVLQLMLKALKYLTDGSLWLAFKQFLLISSNAMTRVNASGICTFSVQFMVDLPLLNKRGVEFDGGGQKPYGVTSEGGNS